MTADHRLATTGSGHRLPCDSVALRVIGAGWGRTGTTSAAAALDVLGFGPCVQMQTMREQPALAEVWAAHYRGEPAHWPYAKVLLTLRDASSWYESVLGSIHA